MKEFFRNLAKFIAVCIAAGLGLGLAMIALISLVAGWLWILGAF